MTRRCVHPSESLTQKNPMTKATMSCFSTLSVVVFVFVAVVVVAVVVVGIAVLENDVVGDDADVMCVFVGGDGVGFSVVCVIVVDISVGGGFV